MYPVIVKAIALSSVLILTLTFSMLPLRFMSVLRHTLDPIRRRKYKRIMSFLSCYGGGVFLGACLLDLFPDVQENFNNVFEDLKFQTLFPFAEFVVTIGFFIVLIIEQIVLVYKENQTVIISERTSLLDRQDSTSSHRSIEGISDHPHPINNNDEHDHSLLFSIHEDPSSHSSLRTVLLLMALSIHSLFEGLAIGLQQQVDQVIQLLTAVIVHKSIIALSLGMNMAQSRLKLKTALLSNVLFSVTTPIGIGVGMCIINLTHSTEAFLVNSVLQGLACGTFLYVTFFEVLPHEMNDGKDRLLKVICIICGYATVAAAVLINPSI